MSRTAPHSRRRGARAARRAARRPLRAALPLLAAALLAACGGGGTDVRDDTGSAGGWSWELPSFFPTPKVPGDNAVTAAKVELGRFLFYDRRLSGNGTQACASCHQQDRAFTDGLAVAVGSTGEAHPRNTQSLANVVYNPTLTWANPSLVTLEKQMETPLFGTDPVEMGINDANQAEVLGRLAADPDYPPKFAAAFPEDAGAIGWKQVIQSISSFQRTILSGASRYDRYLEGRAPLDPAETRGMNLFFGEKAECFHCHSSFNFNDQIVHAGSRSVDTPFHNTGLYNIDGRGGFPAPNRGVYELTGKPEDMGRFRAPSLRNVERTAPYMHDGSVESLAAVLDFYAAGGRVILSGPLAGDGRLSPLRNDFIGRIDLSAQDKADLIAFLKTLTDDELLTDPRFADPFAPNAGGR